MEKKWLSLLEEAVKHKSKSRVAREIGMSPAAVHLVLNGKYQADTRKIEERVMKIYGNGGQVECPVQGPIDPLACADTHSRAKSIGLNVGNSRTLRLYLACRNCNLRS